MIFQNKNTKKAFINYILIASLLCGCANTTGKVTTFSTSTTPEEQISTSESLLISAGETEHSKEDSSTGDILSVYDNSTTEYTTPKESNCISHGGKAISQLLTPIYDYSKPVPKQKTLSEKDFKNSVFIGNSIMDGLKLYCNFDATFYTYSGLNVDSVYSTKFVKKKNKKITAISALESNKKFDRVYLLFGINEAGWPDKKTFIKDYKKLIHAIREINPDAEIYINCILPVSKKKASSASYFSKKNIQKLNKMIQEMAEEENVYYLSPYDTLADSKGYLVDESTSDGIHINSEYTNKWFEYIKTHTLPLKKDK